MLLDYVSFETGVSYDAIKQIYDVYIKETFLDDDETTFDSVLEEIYSTGCVVGIDDDTVKDFKRILGDGEIRQKNIDFCGKLCYNKILG